MLIRVQKILADAGIASRRKCEELIAQGRIRVNGKSIKLGDKAVPENDRITFNDKTIKQDPDAHKVYILINKPWGFVTTVSEQYGMKTVMDLIKVKERIFPVGRLDKFSDGLLLLTNDGDLANKLTHPSFGVSKTYVVKTNQPLIVEDLKKLDSGIVIDDREVAVEKIKMFSPSKFEITIHEGRKHIVRRIFEEMGYGVTKLTRIQFGPLKLGDVAVGKWRYLNTKEVDMLKKAVKK